MPVDVRGGIQSFAKCNTCGISLGERQTSIGSVKRHVGENPDCNVTMFLSPWVANWVLTRPGKLDGIPLSVEQLEVIRDISESEGNHW